VGFLANLFKYLTAMTQEELYDLETLGRSITDTCKYIKTLSALYKGRKFLAKGLRNKYPNMSIDAIRSTLCKQECEQEGKLQLSFDELRMRAFSLGWNIDHKDMVSQVRFLVGKEMVNLNDINL
jgi:hypothetical protein